MSTHRVAVVVPLYNKAPYIDRCLRSIIAQTHQELEIIVVDDGSTDGGDHLVRSVKDCRVRLVSQSNSGVSIARNRGVAEATCDLIFFIDADDEWAPTLVESLIDLHMRCPSAGVVACPTERVYKDGCCSRVTLREYDFREGTELLRDYFASFVRLRQSPFSNSSFAVRKEVFEQVGGYTAGVRLTEDSDLWVRLALCTPMAMIVHALARYYVETEGNTRCVPQTERFEVVRTLEFALDQKQIPVTLQGSARDLLAFLKLMQIRRHVLLGNRRAALFGLGGGALWFQAPVSSLILFAAALVPSALLVRLRNLRRRRIA
jgi:GT2 family glycosyltransferase